MKVLMLSIDNKILKDSSKSQKRMVDYGAITDELHIVVLSNFSYKESKIQISPNVFVYPTGNRFRTFYFFTAFKIGFSILEKSFPKIDLITVQDSFPTGIVGFFLKKLFNTPMQIQVHIDFFSPFFWQESFLNKVYFCCAKFLLPKADAVRVVSNEIKNYLLNNLKISSEKISVLPVFADISVISNYEIKIDLHKKYPQFDFIILMPTRLVRQKNIDMAIRAMNNVVKKISKIGLIIPSAGPEGSRLKFLTKKLDLDKNIIFEPWDCDLFSYYKTADLFLLTSNYEGWALTVTEAMSAGLPVIATKVGCANEIIEDGLNGLLVKLNDHQSLAEKIVFLLNDTVKRKMIAKEGCETIKNLKPTAKSEYLELYLDSFRIGLGKNLDPLWKTFPKMVKFFDIKYSLRRNFLSSLFLFFKQIDCFNKNTVIICSISKDYVELWLLFARRFLDENNWNFIVIDGIGDIDIPKFPNVQVIKFLNIYHGKKLDFILKRIINYKILFICDDDEYLISDLSLPINQLDNDNVPVISLRHREHYQIEINGKKHWPIGSYALLLKPRYFLRYKLGLQSKRKLISKARIFVEGNKENFGYDTSDYANEKLLSLGYQIITYKDGQFVLGFNGLSTAKILLMCRGKEYITQALLEARHYLGINGSLVLSLYSRTKFEELFYFIFKKKSKILSSFNSDELIKIVKSNLNINENGKEKILDSFLKIDYIFDKLKKHESASNSSNIRS